MEERDTPITNEPFQLLMLHSERVGTSETFLSLKLVRALLDK